MSFDQGPQNEGVHYIDNLVEQIDKIEPMDKIQVERGFVNQHIAKKACLWIAYIPYFLAEYEDNKGERQKWDSSLPTEKHSNFWLANLVGGKALQEKYDWSEEQAPALSKYVNNEQLMNSSKPLTLEQSIELLKGAYKIFIDPDGETIVDCIQDSFYAILLKSRMMGHFTGDRLAKTFRVLLTCFGVKVKPNTNITQMIVDSQPQGVYGADFARVAKRQHISRHRGKSNMPALKQALREFQYAVQDFCRGPTDMELIAADAKYGKNIERVVGKRNSTSRPWPYFFKSVVDYQPPMCDSKRLRSLRFVANMNQLSLSKTKSDIQKVLQFSTIKRGWKDFSDLAWVVDCFSNQEIATEEGIKKVYNSARYDPIQKPTFMNRVIKEMLFRDAVPITLAYHLIALGKEIVKLTTTVPKLEAVQREGEFAAGASMMHGQKVQELEIREQLAKDLLQKPSVEQAAILQRYSENKPVIESSGGGAGMALFFVAAVAIYAFS